MDVDRPRRLGAFEQLYFARPDAVLCSHKSGSHLSGGVSGVFSLVVAQHSGKTFAATDKTGSNAKNTSGFLNVALAIAGPIFIACLIALLSLLTSYTLYGIDQLALHHQAGPFAKGLLHSFIGETFFTCVSPREQEGYLAIAPWDQCLPGCQIHFAGLADHTALDADQPQPILTSCRLPEPPRARLSGSIQSCVRKPNLFTRLRSERQHPFWNPPFVLVFCR